MSGRRPSAEISMANNVPGYHPKLGKIVKPESLKARGFYHTPAWKRVRKLALQRDHYLCQLRTSSRCTRYATEVHHIKPLEDYPELGLSLDNLICCCWFCHEETKGRKKKDTTVPVGVRVIRIVEDFTEIEDD